MKTVLPLFALLCFAACDLTLPDAHYGCATGACPDGMHCWSDGRCHTEPGPDASPPDAGMPDAAPDTGLADGGGCGDGEQQATETCDDNNTTAADGCAPDCQVEDGYTCEGQPSTCETTCGDGVLAGDEVCDDANTEDEVACVYGVGACTHCRADCGAELMLTGPVCGDGDLEGGVEVCDDGNTVDEIECAYDTAMCTSCNAGCNIESPLSGRVCGDRVLDPEEQCDHTAAGCLGCAFEPFIRVTSVARSYNPYTSADGRYVIWTTTGRLVAEDTNDVDDVYLRDLGTGGAPELISRSASGAEAANAQVRVSGISDDGDVIVMSSRATNLDPADTESNSDVFVYRRSTGTLRSLTPLTTAPNFAENPQISGGGRFVLFLSDEPAYTGSVHRQIVRYDLRTDTTETVSVNGAGELGTGEASRSAISRDGNVIAFDSAATNLVTPDRNRRSDVFVRNYSVGSTVRVSVRSDGAEADGDSGWPVLSPDGRYVAFWSDATNLVAGDTNGVRDVFAHDLVTRETTRLTLADDGSEPSDGLLAYPSGVTDGGLVVFNTPAALLASDLDTTLDVYSYQLGTRALRILSHAYDGASVPSQSSAARITPDGSVIVFSGAGVLLDINGTHIYRREL